MKSRLPFRHLLGLFAALLILFVCVSAVGQSSAFTYQGRLTDGGSAANGNYDLQFALWDSLSGGNQVGSTQTLNTVAVSNGVFTTSLDFGAGAFPGAGRFLEISARPSGGGSFTTLNPRQQITSTPYAVRSSSAANADASNTATNATQLGGVAASNYVQTNDSRLSDARSPTPGSSNYIQNTSSTQSANFNISGSGSIGGNVGIGTTAPTAKLSVIATGDGARVLHLGTERGWVFKQFRTGAATALELTGDDPSNNNKNFVINTEGRVGIGTTVPQAKLHVAGPTFQDALIVSGTSKFDGGKAEFSPSTQVQVHGLTGGGSTAVCRDSSNSLSFCSSSLRYKKDVSRFGSGLDIISHLRPIAFTWKQDGIRDIGLAAEEVEKVEPLLTFRNNKGEIEGVKYDQLSPVFINAIKEQQKQIQKQYALIEQQQKQIVGLKRLVCRSHRRAAVCN